MTRSPPHGPATDMQGIKEEILAWVAKAQKAQQERDAAWRAQGYTPPHRVARGIKAAAAAKNNAYARDDDATRADATWLMFSLGSVSALKAMNHGRAARLGFSRGHWRQGVAWLIRHQPAEVEDPSALVFAAARCAAKQEHPDPRLAPDYVPLITWGDTALKFIGAVR